MKRLIATLAVLLMPIMAHATAFSVTETRLAVDKVWVLDIQKAGVNSLSAQAVYSSATIPAKTFTDGAASTGSIVVSAVTNLSAATASNSVTVVSTSGLAGAVVTMPGYVLKNGVNWRSVSTTSGTAVSLGAAIAKNPNILVTVSGSTVLMAAASSGTWANAIAVKSSNAGITVATPTMAGGRDSAYVTINGVQLQEGRDWVKGSSVAGAGYSLAAAINTAARLAPFITASASGGTVSLVADANGTAYNFPLVSSIAAIALSGDIMTGGADRGYTTGSPAITVLGHGYTVGLPLLYTEAAGAPISPLVNQTTYYAIPIDVNTLALSATSTGAVAGLYITITSTNSPSHVYTLTPLSITGSAGFVWSVSNDGVSYTDLSIDSVTFSTPYTAATKMWDFGDVPYRYLRVSIKAPLTGAIDAIVTINGYGPSDFMRKTGAQMTGPLLMVGSGAYINTESSVTAGGFFGSGAGLTGVTGAPNGAAGGDLSGTYPNPTLDGSKFFTFTASNTFSTAQGFGRVIVSSVCSADTACVATCGTGKYVTGGACATSDKSAVSGDVGANTYSCATASAADITAKAVCAYIKD